MSIAVVPPKQTYDPQNEAAFREEARRNQKQNYDRRADLIVPFPKRLAFTSAQGQVIFFGYNVDGNFTIQQDAETPFGLASLSYVATVQSDLESSFASLETSLTADFADLSASFTTIAVAFADIETAFAALEVEVEAANDAAAAAATSALAAAASETAAGSSATAAATSATSAATQASNAATSATQASTSETNAAGSAATATTQATNAATSATNAANSATAASTSASTASTQATNAANSASAANTSATNAATSASGASTSASNAATSASQASTSETNAAGSASTASTQATNAANSASAAAGSASAASTSASTASTQATNAGTSASAAATSATNAAASASSASSSASTATTQASNASASASAAASSATLSATYAANNTFPRNFVYNLWFIDEQSETPTNAHGSANFTTSNNYQVVRTVPDLTQVYCPAGKFQPIPGRKYIARWRVRKITAATDGRPSSHHPYFVVRRVDGSIDYLRDSADGVTMDGNSWTLNQWYTVEIPWTVPASGTAIAWARPRWHANWDDAGSSYSNAVYEFGGFDFVDETAITATNASVATNTSAIATESAARAAADTTLTASFTALRSGSNAVALPSTFEKDDLYWTLVGGTLTDVSTIGRVWQSTSGGESVRSRSRLQLAPNRVYRFSARYRVTVDVTNGTTLQPLAGFTTYNSAGTNVAGIWVGSFATRAVADGWVTVTGDYTTATILGVDPTAVSIDAYCQPGWSGSGVTNSTEQVQFVKLEDVTDIVTTNATVSQIAEAYATNDSATARLVWKVNTTTNEAVIEQTAAEGYADGTWNGSAIKLTADEITLDGDVIVTGSLTATQMANNAVTQGVYEETATSTTPTTSWATIADVEVTTPDAVTYVKLDWSFYAEVGAAAVLNTDGGAIEVRILRDATQIYDTVSHSAWPATDLYLEDEGQFYFFNGTAGHAAGFDIDTPGAAGTYTYSLQIRKVDNGGAALTWYLDDRRLFAQMFKR